MNDKNKRTFTIASCITSYSVILTNMNTMEIENIAIAIIVGIFLVLTLIVVAFIFVYSVENKVVEVDKGDEDDE